MFYRLSFFVLCFDHLGPIYCTCNLYLISYASRRDWSRYIDLHITAKTCKSLTYISIFQWSTETTRRRSTKDYSSRTTTNRMPSGASDTWHCHTPSDLPQTHLYGKPEHWFSTIQSKATEAKLASQSEASRLQNTLLRHLHSNNGHDQTSS